MYNSGTRASIAFLVVLLGISFLPLPAFAEQPRSGGSKKVDSDSEDRSGRSGWYFGLGLGAGVLAEATADVGGSRSFDDSFQGATDKSPKIGANIKFGKTLSSRMLLGLDVTGVMQTAKDADQKIINYFLMFTIFPAEEGLFFRVGAGPSSYASKAGSLTYDVSGYGVLGGVGYALGHGKGATLTLNFDYSMQSYSSKGMKSSSFAIAYLGLDWF